MLIGRDDQKKIFNEALTSQKSEMVIVYGRRRVGKTYMIKEILGTRLDFEMTGIQNGDLADQLENFTIKLSEFGFGGIALERPQNWMKAFISLKEYLSTKSRKKKKVIFLDELPWMVTHRSNFLGMLGHFWNDWAVNNNVLMVLCGSAASWMIDKVINNKGGLHNRITQYIPLKPFTLVQTEQFLKAKKIKTSRYQIVQLYMALGGIPYYLELLKASQSIPQNIDRLCFDSNGFLRNEFDRLFKSLFDHSENHISVVKALASKWKGLTRNEIAAATHLSKGGGLTRILDELEKSTFIKIYFPFGKKKKDSLYRLTDNFSLFYLKFISKRSLKDQQGAFLNIFTSPKYRTWCGYAFENICLIHHRQISRALGIEYILHEFSSFRFDGNEDYHGIQIDLLIDRADGIINLCEIKFSNAEFKLIASYKKILRERVNTFSSVTRSRKPVLTTLVTTFGLDKKDTHLDVIQNVVTLDHFFQK